jgi:hypothetical protein
MISISFASFFLRRCNIFVELFETAQGEIRIARVLTLLIWLKTNAEKQSRRGRRGLAWVTREWCETHFDTIFCEPLH